MNNIIDKCLEESLDKAVHNWENSKEYHEAWEKFNKVYMSKLPKEVNSDVVDEINNIEATCSEYFYIAGMKNGVQMFKQLQKFLLGNDEEEPNLKPGTIRAIELAKEYSELHPSDTTNGLREIYIYEKAFEEGKKQGIKEVLG